MNMPSYSEARARFLTAGEANGFAHQVLPLACVAPGGEALGIDVLQRGEGHRTLVCSSGVHGVEGFTGSAVQAALVADAPVSAGVRQIFIHAINPWGMAHYRRVNANNVDLNRNFRDSSTPAPGTHEDYVALYKTLHPSGVSGWDPAMIMAVALRSIWRGRARVKQAITAGQYSHPQGLFFGGQQMQDEATVVSSFLRGALQHQSKVVALDLHTGLGRFGTDTLLSHYAAADARQVALKAAFGDALQPMAADESRAYDIEGGLCRHVDEVAPVPVTFVTQEFGSQNAVRVLVALVREHQAHRAGAPLDHPHKQLLVDAFAADETAAIAQGHAAYAKLSALLTADD